jgi:hypothetical protein
MNPNRVGRSGFDPVAYPGDALRPPCSRGLAQGARASNQEHIMHTLSLSLLAAGLFMGSAHAASVDTRPGFDRVGLASDEPVAVQTVRPVAPGEDRHAVSPERRREMARRLVWLILSAR